MVRLRLVESGDLLTYDYYPESYDQEPGRVAIDTRTGERIILYKAPKDIAGIYKIHAWRRIEEMLESGDVSAETYGAWY